MQKTLYGVIKINGNKEEAIANFNKLLETKLDLAIDNFEFISKHKSEAYSYIEINTPYPEEYSVIEFSI